MVDVLPSPGTASSCIVGTPGVPRPVLPLDEGVFQANTYDVPAGTTGHVGMCYNATPGELFAYANWSHVGATGWFSYPQVTYGVNSWDGAGSTYTNQSPAWSLPQTVGSVVDDSVWTIVNYSFRAPSLSDVDGYDFSLDDFFTETLPPVFEDGPFVEVMVWFAHHITYPTFHTWDAPTLVNGTVESVPWSVGYYCHGTDNGTNANISFDYAYDGQGTSGSPSGTLGVNLSLVLANVEALLPSATCWTGPTSGFSSFHLDEANLGSEDGALNNSSFDYNWTVSGYCFRTFVSVGIGGELGCSASGADPAGASPATEPVALLGRTLGSGPGGPLVAGTAIWARATSRGRRRDR